MTFQYLPVLTCCDCAVRSYRVRAEEEEEEEAGSNTLADPHSTDISINALQGRERDKKKSERMKRVRERSVN